MKSCSKLRVVNCSALEGDLFFQLDLTPPAWEWRPGQFLMLRALSWGLDPFCARPFSIEILTQEKLSIFFQVQGRGTRLLSGLKPGEQVLVWGPLGNGFHYPEDVPLLLLAGGMGIAPFVGLVNTHPRPEMLELIFGHRQPLSCYPFATIDQNILAWNIQEQSPQDLVRLGRALRVKIKGYAQDGLVLACGPHPFLQLVQQIALELGAKAQLSLEAHMACGLGACLGCTHQGTGGQKLRVCADGPVFWADEVFLQ